MLKRRYEILLPLNLNDGRPVSDDVQNQTRQELVQQFEGLSVLPQSIKGYWLHEGIQYEDVSALWTVDVEDTAENRRFFRDFKKTLLQRFEQLEIYMISYPIEIE
jgi:hypothetical protein